MFYVDFFSFISLINSTPSETGWKKSSLSIFYSLYLFYHNTYIWSILIACSSTFPYLLLICLKPPLYHYLSQIHDFWLGFVTYLVIYLGTSIWPLVWVIYWILVWSLVGDSHSLKFSVASSSVVKGRAPLAPSQSMPDCWQDYSSTVVSSQLQWLDLAWKMRMLSQFL